MILRGDVSPLCIAYLMFFYNCQVYSMNTRSHVYPCIEIRSKKLYKWITYLHIKMLIKYKSIKYRFSNISKLKNRKFLLIEGKFDKITSKLLEFSFRCERELSKKFEQILLKQQNCLLIINLHVLPNNSDQMIWCLIYISQDRDSESEN